MALNMRSYQQENYAPQFGDDRGINVAVGQVMSGEGWEVHLGDCCVEEKLSELEEGAILIYLSVLCEFALPKA